MGQLAVREVALEWGDIAKGGDEKGRTFAQPALLEARPRERREATLMQDEYTCDRPADDAEDDENGEQLDERQSSARVLFTVRPCGARRSPAIAANAIGRVQHRKAAEYR